MIGKRVEIYFNLHKKCYSIRDKKSRLVIGHTNNITLENVVFNVSQSGRDRVLREKRKNVHAVVEGTICCPVGIKLIDIGVTYNPYRYHLFHTKEQGTPITSSNYAKLKVYNKIPSIRI